MTDQPEHQAAAVAAKNLTPIMLNHAAWVTHDVEATVEFYTQIMGMELASTVFGDSVPSTGDKFPYFHLFFRMGDGSTFAFFDAPGIPERAPVSHPAYDVFDHIALQARDRAEVDKWRDWLVANGVEVVGPTNHDGLIYSIYFRDPNDIRLEITVPLDDGWNRKGEKAIRDVALWCDTKRQARERGENVADALTRMIRARNHGGH